MPDDNKARALTPEDIVAALAVYEAAYKEAYFAYLHSAQIGKQDSVLCGGHNDKAVS